MQTTPVSFWQRINAKFTQLAKVVCGMKFGAKTDDHTSATVRMSASGNHHTVGMVVIATLTMQSVSTGVSVKLDSRATYVRALT